jgi:hypothetical protein
MAITSFGYDGSVSEVAWATMVSGVGSSEYGVLGSNDFKVTAVAGSDRTVSIAAGSAWGKGVYDTSDANITVQLDTVASGSRWDLISIRRNWSGAAGTTSVLKINGGASRLIPARNTTPGVLDDQPIALVQITAGQTQPTAIVDLRAWGGNGGMAAMDPLALTYLQRIGAQVMINGDEWVCAPTASGTVSWTKINAPFNISLYGTGGYAGGIAPPDTALGPVFLMQAGTMVATSDGAGNGRLIFPQPFPNGLLTVTFTNGDSWASGVGMFFSAAGNSAFWGASGTGSKTDIVYTCWGYQGGVTKQIANMPHRMNWIAIGY